MSALEISQPVLLLVLVESDDPSRHHAERRRRTIAVPRGPPTNPAGPAHAMSVGSAPGTSWPLRTNGSRTSVYRSSITAVPSDSPSPRSAAFFNAEPHEAGPSTSRAAS